jgi:hypothetical protein
MAALKGGPGGFHINAWKPNVVNKFR